MDENELKQRLDELGQEDKAKFDYVFARASCTGIMEALAKSGRSKSWYYAFPKEEQARLESIAASLNAATKYRALAILEAAMVEAAEVKAAGLRSRNESVKQAAATEILDRGIGKVATRTELTGADGGPLEIKTIEIVLPPEDE